MIWSALREIWLTILTGAATVTAICVIGMISGVVWKIFKLGWDAVND